uniref:Uncharacterized protein n=1 Tax=Solanum lycopersicum TaxID=4081 RepID=K4BZN8_SOLLC
MAQECGAVIGAIDFLKRRHLDNFLINHQLNDTRSQLVCVSLFQAKLEEVFLENTISTHVGALFQQANDGFSEICTHMNQLYTIKMAKPLEIFKLNNVAERLEAGSKPSISSREMILQVLEILRPENIAEKIKASKSSSKINTMEMVRQDTVHNVLMHAEVTANKIAKIIKGGSTEEIGLLLSEIESVKVEIRKVCYQFLDASPYNMTEGEDLITLLSELQDWLL